MKLNHWLSDNKVTLKELADAVGVGKSTIIAWKEGRIPDSFRHLKRLEKFTKGEVMLEDLLMNIYSKNSQVKKEDHYDTSDE